MMKYISEEEFCRKFHSETATVYFTVWKNGFFFVLDNQQVSSIHGIKEEHCQIMKYHQDKNL